MTDLPEESIVAPVAPPAQKRDPAWGYLEIATVVASFVLALFLCGGLGYALARTASLFHGATPQQITTNPLFFIPVQLAAYVLTFGVMAMIVSIKSDERFFTAIRWSMPTPDEGLRYALLGVGMALAVQVLSAFLPFPKSLPMHEYFREVRFAYVMAAFGLAVAPLAEELFFRGLLFPVLVRTMGQVAAVVATGAMFSLMHRNQLAWAWAPMLVLFGVGMVLTTVRARSDSVAASWITHVAYNGTLFALLFYFSNGFRSLAR